MKKKKLLTEEEHSEMIAELMLIDSPQQAREFHKKYKKHGHGLPLLARYPNLPRYISYVSILLSMLALMLSVSTLL